MLFNSYSPNGAPLPVQRNAAADKIATAAAAELTKLLQQRSLPIPAPPRASPDKHSLLSSSLRASSPVFRKHGAGAGTPPKYELVRKPSATTVGDQTTTRKSTGSPPVSVVANAEVCTAPVKVNKTKALRSILKRAAACRPAPIYKSENEPRQTTITFGRDLEEVVVFAKESSVDAIKLMRQYRRQDTGKVNFSTLSKALEVSEIWIMKSKNIPIVPGFGGNQIVLDSVQLENGRALVGNVLVRNLAYDKNVAVHYTIDDWTTSHDIPAQFVRVVSHASGDFRGFDKFMFRIDLNREFGAQTNAANLIFALRYDVGGSQYWDNNNGQNYKVELCRPDADYHPPQPVHVTHPLFHWSDPALEIKPQPPVRPPTAVPIEIPAAPRRVPMRTEPASSDFLPITPPEGHPVSGGPVTLPLSNEQRRVMRAVSIAQASTLAKPWMKYSPPGTPVITPAISPAMSFSANLRSPSPTSFSDGIEMPFSGGGSPHIGRRMTYTGTSRLYADADSYVPIFGCSPPGTPQNGFAANAACRA